MVKRAVTELPVSRFERTRRVDLDRLLDPPFWPVGTGEYDKTIARVISVPEIDDDDEVTMVAPRGLPTALPGAPSLPGYDLIREIGGGGMSLVYEGIHRTSGCRVAIKYMRQSCAVQPELVQRFLAEAVAASHLTHPGAADVFDYGHDRDGVPYLVMEYLDGESLTERLGRGPLAPAELVAIVKAVAEVAQAAHDIGIVHRDLKPDNIFLATGPGPARVMLLDFGVAKFRSPDIYARTTQAGQVLGTPHYMAPEQCAGAEIDARTDVYALGCVMYQMLTGRVPFGGDIVGVIAGHMNATPPSIGDLNPDVPLELIKLVESMMSKSADDRPSSMTEIVDAIDVAAASAVAPRLGPGEVAKLESASRRCLADIGNTINTSPGLAKPRHHRGLGLMLSLILAAASSASIWLSLAG